MRRRRDHGLAVYDDRQCVERIQWIFAGLTVEGEGSDVVCAHDALLIGAVQPGIDSRLIPMVAKTLHSNPMGRWVAQRESREMNVFWKGFLFVAVVLLAALIYRFLAARMTRTARSK